MTPRIQHRCQDVQPQSDITSFLVCRQIPVMSAASSAAVAANTSATPAAVSRPLVGVGVLITDSVNHPGRLLVGERLGSHGAKTFATPGGHLEFGEGWAECASREVKEETNLDLIDLEHVSTQNNVFAEVSKHYVTLFMHGRISPQSAPLQLMEPEKCREWIWISWADLKRKAASGEIMVFPPLRSLLNDQKFKLPEFESSH
jgi:8-oxo-dGTP diphosphatase